MDSKRRRVENDYTNGHAVASSSRGAVKAPARAGQDNQQSRTQANFNNQKDPNQPYYPLVSTTFLSNRFNACPNWVGELTGSPLPLGWSPPPPPPSVSRSAPPAPAPPMDRLVSWTWRPCLPQHFSATSHAIN